MNVRLAYLAPLLVGLGAWLTAPQPHPWFPVNAVLALALVALVVTFIGVAWGSQRTVLVGLIGALLTSFPPVVPFPWTGPLVLVLGAILALEGASAKNEALPLPSIRAWLLPLGLFVFALLVPLAALATQVGRESLDITQGMGIAVTAPFLLAAAWGLWVGLERRGMGLSRLLPAAVIVLLAGGLVMAAPHASGQFGPDPCEEPRAYEAFQGCPTASHVLAQEHTSENVTTSTWSLNASRLLLIDPGLEHAQISNFTFQDATLEIPLQTHVGGCQGETLVLERAQGSWNDETTVPDAPEGADPVTVTLTDDQCAGLNAVPVNVTEHLQAWAQDAPLEGWRISTPSTTMITGSGGPYAYNATYRVNAPTIEEAILEPASQGGTVMLPVGETATLTANLTDPHGNLHEATILVDEETAHQERLTHPSEYAFTFPITDATAQGPLTLRVTDWDGNDDTMHLAEAQPDRENPQISSDPTPGLEPTNDGFTLTRPVPEAEPASIQLNLTDDACPHVEACIDVRVVDEDGAPVANQSANQTHPNVDVPLPTNPAGERALILAAQDPAQRVNTTIITYRVSEPRAPTLENLTLTDHLDRENQQEAGLPLTLTMNLADESPPVRVNVTDAGTLLATATVTNKTDNITLTPTMDTAGTRALTVTADDRWGNQERQTRTVEIHPQRAPAIEMPTSEHIPANAKLHAHVNDASLAPENVTVNLVRGGTTLEATTITRTLTPTGVDLDAKLPELLHGERIRFTLTATDAFGHFNTETSDHTVDATPPTLNVAPDPGAERNGTLWTLPDATLFITATDDASGVDTLELIEPHNEALPPEGGTLTVENVRDDPLHVHAQDGVGNHANWTGQLKLDDEPPQANVTIDGHDVIVTLSEDGSGLGRVTLTANEDPLSVPNVVGEHRVTLPNATRGDEVDITLTARDHVGHATTHNATLTVQDAPPDVRIGTPTDGNIALFMDDPDGDPVTTSAHIEHAVNGTTHTFPPDRATLTLPSWRGDMHLTVEATAHNATINETRTLTLGEAPYVHATLPEAPEPGTPATVRITWERAYESLTLVALDDGQQHALADVTITQPGEGHATLTLEDPGAYDLEIRAQHEDGTLDTQGIGTLDAQAPPNPFFLAIGLLLLVALVGTVLLNRFRDQEGDEEAQPGPRAGP